MNQKERRAQRQEADDRRIKGRQQAEAKKATPVNSIQIPDRFVKLCEHWHGGQRCTLYAVSSTGNLSMGNILPYHCDTDEQWYLTIWRNLAVDIMNCRMAAELYESDSIDILTEFEKYADNIVEQLKQEYNLADWWPDE